MGKHYQTRRKDGKRSGLESQVAAQLDSLGVKYSYESIKLGYEKPASLHHYTPDFILPNGLIIEAKGRFVTADRQKHKLIKEQHPDKDIRFVFSSSKQKIGKKSSTTYGMWCERNGFKFSDRTIPVEWINENKDVLEVSPKKAIK